jgi:regulator of nucleoside diphosphate kinase
MIERTIFITKNDAERLSRLVDDPSVREHREQEYLESLMDELSRAQVVAQEDIPPDVVTMNSTVHLIDMDTGEEETYTLVFPGDADLGKMRISVLAPIGTAMLGNRSGDTLTWAVPDGERHLRVKEVVYQPEAFGDYHL